MKFDQKDVMEITKMMGIVVEEGGDGRECKNTDTQIDT